MLFFLKENQIKFNISNIEWLVVIFHEVITVSIFLAQQITTKIDLRYFEKPGPDYALYQEALQRESTVTVPCCCLPSVGLTNSKCQFCSCSSVPLLSNLMASLIKPLLVCDQLNSPSLPNLMITAY